MSRKLRLEDLDDTENGLLRTALRFYLHKVRRSRQGLVRTFGDEADLSGKDAQIARLEDLIARLRSE